MVVGFLNSFLEDCLSGNYDRFSTFGQNSTNKFDKHCVIMYFPKLLESVKTFFCFIPTKISHKLCDKMDGTQF
jgi:hypothetical protein